MLKAKITALKDFILENNTYFDAGYDNVYLDETRGWVKDENVAVFPNDTLGNYFYMRLDSEMRFEAGNYNRQSDSQINMGIRASVYLVAFMRGGDPDTLLNNIISTIQQSACSVEASINFTGAIYESSAVIERELKKIGDANVKKALQNLDKNVALVSVRFDISDTYTPTPLNCIEKPCATC